MPDYREMYHTIMRDTEKAINILISAQRKCEELYVSSPDPEIKLFIRDSEEQDQKK